jgi:hypothetical protein
MREILINQAGNLDKREEELASIDLVEPYIDENDRLLSQGGLFTRTPNGEDIEEFCRVQLNLTGMAPILYRIEIPENQREVFLRHLEAMNIHFGSLFPDITGAAGFSNRGLEKERSEIQWKQRPEFIRRMLGSNAVHE